MSKCEFPLCYPAEDRLSAATIDSMVDHLSAIVGHEVNDKLALKVGGSRLVRRKEIQLFVVRRVPTMPAERRRHLPSRPQ